MILLCSARITNVSLILVMYEVDPRGIEQRLHGVTGAARPRTNDSPSIR